MSHNCSNACPGYGHCKYSVKYGSGPRLGSELFTLMGEYVRQGGEDKTALQAYADASGSPQNFHIHCGSTQGDQMLLWFWTSADGTANTCYCLIC
jgi:hypothetical protein